jgi:hypothetical protein
VEVVHDHDGARESGAHGSRTVQGITTVASRNQRSSPVREPTLGLSTREQRYGPPNTFWQLRLSDVERLRDRGEPIPVKEAARLLRCTTDDVRTLIADGKLTAVPGSRRPVYLLEVQALAADTDVPPHQPLPPEGCVNTREAARTLGPSISRTRQLAAEGRIPAQRDENGNYWYKRDQLEMVRRLEHH